MAVASQMNVRIDPQLKEQGDRILATQGLSPSQAIRAFYECLVGTAEQSDKVLSAVFGRTEKQADVDAEKLKKLESIRRVQDSIRATGCTGSNSMRSPFDEAAADKALLAEVVFEHYAQKEAS